MAMRERRVKQILAERLLAEGFMNLRVRYGNERGIDMEAQFPESGRRLYIEVKGERPGKQEASKRRVAFAEALLQIFFVYDSFAVCAIGVPHTRSFRRLVQKLHLPLKRLGLHVLLVDRDGRIWHLDPQNPPGVVRPVSSLANALGR